MPRIVSSTAISCGRPVTRLAVSTAAWGAPGRRRGCPARGRAGRPASRRWAPVRQRPPMQLVADGQGQVVHAAEVAVDGAGVGAERRAEPARGQARGAVLAQHAQRRLDDQLARTAPAPAGVGRAPPFRLRRAPRASPCSTPYANAIDVNRASRLVQPGAHPPRTKEKVYDMRVLLVGAGGVGTAVTRIAARRAFFDAHGRRRLRPGPRRGGRRRARRCGPLHRRPGRRLRRGRRRRRCSPSTGATCCSTPPTRAS